MSDSPRSNNVQLFIDEQIATLTINRPKAMNALDRETVEALADQVATVAREPNVRVVVITGAGEKAFVAGADITAMTTMSAADALAFSQFGHRALQAIEALPMPVLAAVNGFALGGGLELAMAADLIYASDTAKFGQPEVNLGLMPGFGGCVRLPRRIGRAAASSLIFSGDIIDAAQAKALGLVAAVFPAADLLAEVQGMARKIALKAPLAVRAAKQVMRVGLDIDVANACVLEAQAFAHLFTTADQREGCTAFTEKRTASFVGR